MLQPNAPLVDSTPPIPATGASAITRRGYHVKQLVYPPTGHGFRPFAVNDDGDVVGNLIHPLRFEGASWTASGLYLPPHQARNTDFPTAERAYPFTALSSNGLVAGTVGNSADQREAWASHLGAFGRRFWPDTLSFAQDVNAQGTVVGKTLLPADPVLVSRAFSFRLDEAPRYFSPPEGGLTDAIAINDRETVLLNVTAVSTRAPRERAWQWHDHAFTALQVPPRSSSTGTALNAQDDVVGLIETEFGLRRPVIWSDGRPVDLGTTSAQDFRPTCLNDDRVIGGSAFNARAQRAACIWSEAAGLQFLETLIDPSPSGPFTEVTAINNRGQILATGGTPKYTLGFLLSPQN